MGRPILNAGQFLSANEFLTSDSGRFRFGLYPDGNFALDEVFPHLQNLWQANTHPGSTALLAMQPDGNLILFSSGPPFLQQNEVFVSSTNGNPGAYLAIQDDGNGVIYTANHVSIWSTGTQEQPAPTPPPPPTLYCCTVYLDHGQVYKESVSASSYSDAVGKCSTLKDQHLGNGFQVSERPCT